MERRFQIRLDEARGDAVVPAAVRQRLRVAAYLDGVDGKSQNQRRSGERHEAHVGCFPMGFRRLRGNMPLTTDEIAAIAAWQPIQEGFGRDNSQTESRIQRIVEQIRSSGDLGCEIVQDDGLSNYFVWI